MSQEQHVNHPTVRLYVVFCIILGLITALEWALFEYRGPLGLSNALLVGSLSVLSLVKFFMVVGWYMHLRYDPQLIKVVFLFAFFLVLAIAAGLIVLMFNHHA